MERNYIEAPVVEPCVGGLLTVADVITASGQQVYNGNTYEPEHFGPARLVPAVGADKTFDGLPEHQDTHNIAVYHGFEHSLFQDEKAQERARKALEAGEGFAVERYLWDNVFDTNVDLTPVPGTGVSVKAAIGLIEEYMGQQYMGCPMLHVGRFGTAHLDSNYDEQKTENGSPVANGAGYRRGFPANPAFPAFWIVATGQVTIWRTEAAFNVGREPHSNTTTALAERLYDIAVQGPVAAVLASE